MKHELSENERVELKEIHKQIEVLTKRAIQILSGSEDVPSKSQKPVISEKEHDFSQAKSIVLYTDGACAGNPGPAGSGVVIMQGEKVIHEFSKSLGKATNNIAELTAIKIGLEYMSSRHDTQITVYTDSTYAIGILTKNWKAKANLDLVSSIKNLMKPFKKISIKHVKGHNGDFGNERADKLAVKGVRSQR
ncbi:ribonuclease HI [Desulfobacula sp.]|uniref:ribonuclease HI n=1 Tax=Desulfobacula sp. TaxID=2593537 RepID=UPI0025BF96D1|nr:ribonuclease H [Desulfobacula sp.]MBC2705954.1 ribonuclease HI [Desulfobacula sp.]